MQLTVPLIGLFSANLGKSAVLCMCFTPAQTKSWTRRGISIPRVIVKLLLSSIGEAGVAEDGPTATDAATPPALPPPTVSEQNATQDISRNHHQRPSDTHLSRAPTTGCLCGEDGYNFSHSLK